MDPTTTFTSVTAFFTNLEGPYKWYAIVAIVLVLSTIFTRFVFKTVKWLVVLILLGSVAFFVLNHFWGK